MTTIPQSLTSPLRALALTAFAAAAISAPAQAALVFTGTTTFAGGSLYSNGGSVLPAPLPVGGGLQTFISFSDSEGVPAQGISWQLERTSTAGPVPLPTDFRLSVIIAGNATASPVPVTVQFDGIKTYTFSIASPIPTFVNGDGSAVFSYMLTPRDPLPGEIPFGETLDSIVYGPQMFSLVAIPEPGSALLSGLGLLALLRRRR